MEIKITKKEKIKILNGDDLYKVMQSILLREDKIDQNREHFWVVGLENNNRILFIELVSLGTINATLVEPMEVFSFALQKRAVKIIVVHNHPSGDLVPSFEDKDVTDRLYQVGKIVKCEVVDHLIISTEKYMSFVNTGLLAKIAKSTKYVPLYELESRMQKQMIKIAKELKRLGQSPESIAETTGLPLAKVKRLRAGKKK